jgi:hypothetical protein
MARNNYSGIQDGSNCPASQQTCSFGQGASEISTAESRYASIISGVDPEFIRGNVTLYCSMTLNCQGTQIVTWGGASNGNSFTTGATTGLAGFDWAAFPVGLFGSPNSIIVRPQGYNLVSVYEYGPDGGATYRTDWGDPHGGNTTDPHLHVIDPEGENPSSYPIDFPGPAQPPTPWRPDGPYSTYPKGAPPIVGPAPLVPICVMCGFLQRFYPWIFSGTAAPPSI